MKNLLTIIGATATMGLAAQNANVVSAYNYMKDGNLPKAVEYIEPAILDAKTSDCRTTASTLVGPGCASAGIDSALTGTARSGG